MANKELTFSGGFLLGAGLMYLLDPERSGRQGLEPNGQNDSKRASEDPRDGGRPAVREPSRAPASWNLGLQCIAGALGIAAVAYGAKWIARAARGDTSTATAFDTDVPNYAWLR